MNIPFIAKIAKTNPALARLLEASIISLAAYVLAAIVEGDPISLQAAVVALTTPIYLAVAKVKRDLEKKQS